MIGRRAAVTAAIAVAVTVLGEPAGSHARPAASELLHTPAAVAASTISSSESGVHFSAKTIVVPRSDVNHNLIGISATGTFEFRHAKGPLARLRKGSIMLLQGSDAVAVTAIAHSHGKLMVKTRAAALTEVVSSGNVSFSGSPNFREAFVTKASTEPGSAAAAAFTPPGYPYVDDARRAGGKFVAQGSSGVFGYSLTFTPVSNTRLEVEGTLCFISGSVCGNGPATGVDAEINLKGYIEAANATGNVSINGGHLTGTTFTIGKLTSSIKLTYQVLRGEGSDGNADPPVFRVPFGLDLTIPGQIPLYLKLQTAILIKLGITAKNTSIHGGVEFQTTGADNASDSGSSLSGAETGESLSGQVLDQANGGVPPTIALGPSGVVVAVQFPKLGIGLGVTSLNGIAYVDVITALGQTTGAAVAGEFCSIYDLKITKHAGLEAQIGLGPLGLALQSKPVNLGKILNKTFAEPGCPGPTAEEEAALQAQTEKEEKE
jgi:hypothetical protein